MIFLVSCSFVIWWTLHVIRVALVVITLFARNLKEVFHFPIFCLKCLEEEFDFFRHGRFVVLSFNGEADWVWDGTIQCYLSKCGLLQ